MTIEHYLEWPNDHDATFQYKHEMANEIKNLARDTIELGDLDTIVLYFGMICWMCCIWGINSWAFKGVRYTSFKIGALR